MGGMRSNGANNALLSRCSLCSSRSSTELGFSRAAVNRGYDGIGQQQLL